MTRLKKTTERRKEKKDAQIVRYVGVFLSLNRLAGVDAGFKEVTEGRSRCFLVDVELLRARERMT